MLLGNFKRGKDKRKRKPRFQLSRSTPYAKGQSKLLNGKYMTPAGSVLSIGIPTAFTTTVGGGIGYMTGAISAGKGKFTDKKAFIGATIGAGLAGGLTLAEQLHIHKKMPQSSLYQVDKYPKARKRKKKKELYY